MGQLAFVRADAYLIQDGQRRSHNIDDFTLIRDEHGHWRLVNGSYTTKPVQPQEPPVARSRGAGGVSEWIARLPLAPAGAMMGPAPDGRASGRHADMHIVHVVARKR